MRGHVEDEMLLDVLEGTAGEEARQHAAACASCAGRVEDARLGLEWAREAEVPEPSPLYWDAFRRNVGQRLEAGRRWRPAVWVPAMAAAGLAVAIAWLPSLGRGPQVTPAPLLPAWSALPPAEQDEALDVMAAAAPVEDLGSVAECGSLSGCLSELSEEETVALANALRSELGESDS
jgi:hypothetical protein